MGKVKCFSEFINETYLEDPADVEFLKHNHKKMKKNGYIEVEITEPVNDLNKGDKVLVSATEFGQLDNDAMVTCYTENDDKIIVPKKNLKVEI